MERCFRCLLLVGCLAFLAVLGNGANGQTTSTASTSDNAAGSDVTVGNDTDSWDLADVDGDEEDGDWNDVVPIHLPGDVTDDSYDDVSPTDNTTLADVTDEGNVTSPDSESEESSEFEYYDDEYKDDEYYDDVDEYPDMTSANVTNTTEEVTDSDIVDDSDFEYYDEDDEYDDGEYYDDVDEYPDVTSANATNITAEATDSDTIDDSDDVTPSNDTSAGDVTSPNDTSSESVIPVNDTDEASAATGVPEKADFVVLDRNGEPCLLASLNITIHFKYHVQEGLVRQTYDLVSKQNTQDGSSYQGSCQDKSSTLSVTWNDTFTLNFTFIMQSAKEGKRNEIDMDVLPAGVNSSSESWSLHQVSLSYDTANQHMFPGAINPAVEMVSAKDLNLFRTPWGMSYVCHTPEVVTVEFKDVDLAFNYVHLMPFDVHSRNFSNDTVQCSGDMVGKPGAEESYTVPLVVAAVLASIVIIILVVYSAVRCVARRVRQAEYKQME